MITRTKLSNDYSHVLKLLGVSPVHVRELLHGSPPPLVFRGRRGLGANAGEARRGLHHVCAGGDLAFVAFVAFGNPRSGHRVGAPPLLLGGVGGGHGGYLGLLGSGTHSGLKVLALRAILLLGGGSAHDVGACGQSSDGTITA